MAATTVKVHRRKAPGGLWTRRAHTRANKPTCVPKRSETVEPSPPSASALLGARTPAKAPAKKAAAPTLAQKPTAALASPVRPATSRPVLAPAGGMLADPFIATRARRGTYPLEAPSWRSFRNYITDRSEFDELRTVGLRTMVQAHRRLAFALIAVGACALLTLAAVIAYFAFSPATADADSPYLAADAPVLESTSQTRWKAGEIPSLYQSDESWGSLPYGQATIGAAGSAPTALAMAYVAATGDTEKTPADFARWATEHDLTASGEDTVKAYLLGAAGSFGLSLSAIETDEHSLRRAIVSNIPVLIVTEPGTFQPVTSVVVLDDIDRDSRIVLHDPTSAMRTNKSWAFDDVAEAAIAAYEVHPA